MKAKNLTNDGEPAPPMIAKRRGSRAGKLNEDEEQNPDMQDIHLLHEAYQFLIKKYCKAAASNKSGKKKKARNQEESSSDDEEKFQVGISMF